MSYSIERLDNDLAWYQVTVETGGGGGPVQLCASAGWTGLTASQQQSLSAVQLTNNDPTNDIFVGKSDLVSPTNYWFKIPAQGFLPADLQHMGRKPFANLWAVSVAGSPLLSVALLAG
jgi:hypothetical protein